MAKKEALAEFQSRLANRLQSLEGLASGDSASWLAVEIAGKGFMFPLSHSGEIFPWVEPQSIPYTKNWFLGVANLRGALCGVVSLEKYLTISDLNGSADEAKSLQDRRLIGFHPSLDFNTVLVVDKLVGLKNRLQMSESETVVGQYVDQQGLLWQEVDLRMLVQNPAFISIAQ